MDRIVPWHQLRTFEALWCPVTPSSCLDALRQSRLLESCCITLSEEPLLTSTVISTEEKIVLANMDYFEAEFLDSSGVTMFLQPLVMPNIITFSIGATLCEKLNCVMPAIIGIIQRSGGMRCIRRLDIGLSSDVLDVGVLLELLPSLHSISIRTGHLTDNAIQQLSSGKLGPQLCRIGLEVVQHDADQILSMVESRYQNATQFFDREQIKDTSCSFKSIWVPCKAPVNKSLCCNKIELLSEKCDAKICLLIDPEWYSGQEYMKGNE